MPVEECKKCHRLRKHYAKGLCNSCYHTQYYEQYPRRYHVSQLEKDMSNIKDTCKSVKRKPQHYLQEVLSKRDLDKIRCLRESCLNKNLLDVLALFSEETQREVLGVGKDV